jgi:hypothetical protein
MSLGSNQSPTDLRTLSGGKARLARKADSLSAVNRLSRRRGSLDVSQPCGPPRSDAGIALRTFLRKITVFRRHRPELII